MTPTDDELDATARFAYEVGHLSRTPRTGWQMGYVRDPESVAEHSHRASIVAFIIAHAEGADPYRAATLAAFHDVPECRSMDLHSMAKRYDSTVDPELIAKDQTNGMPAGLASAVQAIIGEVEAKESPESLCSRDADKIDALLRAREYMNEGYTRLQPWVDNMIAATRTSTGRELAERAARTDPSAWWFETAEAYGLPAQP